jgi:hypothetical protein
MLRSDGPEIYHSKPAQNGTEIDEHSPAKAYDYMYRFDSFTDLVDRLKKRIEALLT